MRWLIRTLVILAIIGAAGLWITRPKVVDPESFAEVTGEAEAGKLAFAAMGCAGCHMAKDGDAMILAGGQAFATDFGTFYAPNISPHDTQGIGSWTDLELANAIVHGTLPGRRHAYPAFPYAAYNKATLQDVADAIAYLRTLPPDPTPSKPHDVGFPFNIRASLGGWKMLFVSEDWVMTDGLTEQQLRGRYLAEALGHCGECHTERNVLGGLNRAAWLQGAANPSGEGRIPGISQSTLDWSESDIAAYLSSGFTPEFDVAGGKMVDVIENISQLPEDDIAAIAAYLKAVP